jgi:uncharacterized protein affecting Mg2+/Co2+ transport
MTVDNSQPQDKFQPIQVSVVTEYIEHQSKPEENASYQYTSGVILNTPIGTMQGSYQLLDDKGDPFDAAISPFLLSTPNAVH